MLQVACRVHMSRAFVVRYRDDRERRGREILAAVARRVLFVRQRRAAVVIQSVARRRRRHALFSALRECVVPLQASWRGAAGRTLCAQRLRAVIDIQRAFRLLKVRKLGRHAQHREHGTTSAKHNVMHIYAKQITVGELIGEGASSQVCA